MPSNHLILCHPLLLPPSVFPSIGVFSNESVLRIRWTKYWSFSFSINPSNAYSGLISFRIDWLDLLTVQGTLKSILQHHSSKASTHPALRLLSHPNGGAWSHRRQPTQPASASRSAGQSVEAGKGERFRRLRPGPSHGWAAVVRAPEPCRTRPVPWVPCSLA